MVKNVWSEIPKEREFQGIFSDFSVDAWTKIEVSQFTPELIICVLLRYNVASRYLKPQAFSFLQ